ncbi:hypothetical protein PMPD1_1131 [Paramixta manurensis]|uniref:DUF1496 domain-containing protein n=1 Tax=Paramixta manurensis TaxID=2740817 RepID=A0A6M8U610_9GAMM|nr:hypothetical protein PMPD1_1131 [Erwiniaceae bacterium PD-1]
MKSLPFIWRFMPCLLLAATAGFASMSQAETVTISLSQEQDGGDMGRACIYVYQGKAEFRVVKPQEKCQPEITIDKSTPDNKQTINSAASTAL